MGNIIGSVAALRTNWLQTKVTNKRPNNTIYHAYTGASIYMLHLLYNWYDV